MLNNLDNQAGSCTAKKWDLASGLDGFATRTAILFNCITSQLAASGDLQVVCNTSVIVALNRGEALVFGQGLILCSVVWQ